MNKNYIIFILIWLSNITIAQQFIMDGRLGYGVAHGPIETFTGSGVNISSGVSIKKLLFKLHYNHFSGNADYGTLYSKDTPNVPVIDKYTDNYPLREWINKDFRETKVGIYQYDPSFSFYISHQGGIDVGLNLPFKLKNKSLYFRPIISGTYTFVTENFIYGTKLIKIQQSFGSEVYVDVNHIIFAYLKYTDFGYGLSLPISYEINPQFELVADYYFHQTLKGLKSHMYNVGISTKF